MNFPYFSFGEQLQTLEQQALACCAKRFEEIDAITQYNQQKVLAAFQQNRISDTHLYDTTGYGYDDRGREALDKVFATAVGAEDALFRSSFASGTHALTVALFGILRPGDTMLSITGAPYDTLEEVIGLRGQGKGSLKDFGVHYSQIDLTNQEEFDIEAIKAACKGVKMVYIQRSRGYSLRQSLSIGQVKSAIDAVRSVDSEAHIVVDNCYCEFVDLQEPTQIGADLIIGSLIKNPGGGIAQSGGYVAGKQSLVELCAYRLTTPGTGRELGCSLGQNRNLYMGLYHAPTVTGEAQKVATFANALFDLMGYTCYPKVSQRRADIISAICLGDKERLVAFCRGIQAGAAIDSFVVPEPSDMPGYESQVIMAAGAFTMGSSIELSADAPIREPFAVWFQGGLNFGTGKIGVLKAAQLVLELDQKSNQA